MTLTLKNPQELHTPGKLDGESQNGEKNGGQSPRSNPACMEVNVMLRSLPDSAGQPIREEGKSVIVFDNGAVLRITNNLPLGQTVILSNPDGREVVCRAVTGRNLPSVKGYVEVEFVEPTKDFWGSRQDQGMRPAPAAAPAVVAQLAAQEAPSVPSPLPVQAGALSNAPGQEAPAPSGKSPSFDDIPGLDSAPISNAAREIKTQSAKPTPDKIINGVAESAFSTVGNPASVSHGQPQRSERPAEKRAIAPTRATPSSVAQLTSARPRDFMAKGLMAYEQPRSSAKSSTGRTLLIVAALATVLAGAGGAWFFTNQETPSVAVAKPSETPQAAIVPGPPAPKIAPAQVPATPNESSQAQDRPVAIDQPQSVTAVAVPAVVKGAAVAGEGPDSIDVRRQDENARVTKQPGPLASRHPAIPNLKLASPRAPIRASSNFGDGAAPITEIAATDSLGATPPAGLLTSSGRSYNPPAPPPGASAPATAPANALRTVREPKLIASTGLVYPAAARQSHVAGSVSLSVNFDENGKVVSAKALSGPMLLRQAAVDSVSRWKYSPGSIDGKPTPSQLTVSVEFRLN